MTVTLDQTEATQTRPAEFWADGACYGLDPELFHPERGASTSNARAVCAACAVRPDCLRWAITNHEHFGVWGGTSERERRRIRHRLTHGDPVPELDPDWSPTGRRGQPLTLAPPPGAPPTPEETAVDLTVATSEPASATNGTGPPTDPATGRLTDVCVNCGKRYTPDRRTQRFCRKECARAWYSSHPRSENGTRQPRARKPHSKAPEVAASPPTAPTGPVDVQALLGQLLAACDRWAIEADLGDIRVSVTRGCHPGGARTG
jgi:WhiB family transcriptional regulator, redox-sensing transcriptional regulator